MKELLTFLTALIVLAVAQSVANVAAVALIGIVLMSAVVHPARTLACVAALGGLALAVQRPALSIAAAALVCVIPVITAAWRERRRPPVDRGRTPLIEAPKDNIQI